jgi:hypothetical protein
MEATTRRMQVRDHHTFNAEFPEQFNWGGIDNRTASSMGEELSKLIATDMRTADRNLVPGLRRSLCELALIATVDCW